MNARLQRPHQLLRPPRWAMRPIRRWRPAHSPGWRPVHSPAWRPAEWEVEPVCRPAEWRRAVRQPAA